MKGKEIKRLRSIREFHQFQRLPAPEHPLISIINVEDLKDTEEPVSFIQDYYSISLKRNFSGKFKYGQQEYDFDSGMMVFIAPGQILNIMHTPEEARNASGFLLLIHPDFFWKTTLVQKIKTFEFFDYSVNEALFLSEKEEQVILNLLQNVEQEYHTNIDRFSQDIIVSLIETLLNYSERFYKRQFITRQITSHQIIDELQKLLTDYFLREDLASAGLPSVLSMADSLHVSPNYLSGLLKELTGLTTQHHIHEKLIERAKQLLSTTPLSVSEIAYQLGFEHSQSFSKLFKTKTTFSPLEFRASFN